MAAGRRPYQDYSAWQNYGIESMWKDIEENPMLTPEIICQRLRRAGLYNPSEVSAADITAGALVAMHGPPAAVVGSSELHRMYTWIKAVGSPAKLEKVAVTGSRPCPCV